MSGELITAIVAAGLGSSALTAAINGLFNRRRTIVDAGKVTAESRDIVIHSVESAMKILADRLDAEVELRKRREAELQRELDAERARAATKERELKAEIASLRIEVNQLREQLAEQEGTS